MSNESDVFYPIHNYVHSFILLFPCRLILHFPYFVVSYILFKLYLRLFVSVSQTFLSANFLICTPLSPLRHDLTSSVEGQQSIDKSMTQISHSTNSLCLNSFFNTTLRCTALPSTTLQSLFLHAFALILSFNSGIILNKSPTNP